MEQFFIETCNIVDKNPNFGNNMDTKDEINHKSKRKKTN